MRRVAIILAATLLIAIPAFAFNGQPAVVEPIAIVAGPTDNATETPIAILETERIVKDDALETVEDEAVEDEVVEEQSVEAAEEAAVPSATIADEPAISPVKLQVLATSADNAVKAETPVIALVQAIVEPEPTPAPTVQAVTTVVDTPIVAVTPTVVAVTPAVVAADLPPIVADRVSQGVITINYANTVRARLEVRKGDVKYYYNLYPGQEDFPLQLGSGQYTITVFENTTENKYRAAERLIVDVTLSSTNVVFLASVQEIKWSSSSSAVAKAKSLVSGASTDQQKFEAIYNYIVANIDYDTPKLATLTSTYLPNIDSTLASGKGICYDHASLMAAMLRSVGVPTKLVKGYASTVQGFHAWNEVYVNGQWIIVDASVDAQRRARGAEITVIKSSDVYQKTQEF